MLGGNEAGQSFESNCGGGSTACGKDLWDKSTMFHLEDSLLVCSFFSPLCLQYMELVDDEMLEGAKELKTLTSNRCCSGCCPKF